MTRVLLVTGSRSLALHPGAEVWARGLIHATLVGVDLLIVGDASGPDAWAWEIAEDGWLLIHDVSTRPSALRRVHCYRTRGHERGSILLHDGYMHGRHFALETVGTWEPTGSTHPLRRNAAMVRDVAAMRDEGHDVRCLALLDGTKRDAPGKRATRGTEHTAGLAERSGIAVQREVWNG